MSSDPSSHFQFSSDLLSRQRWHSLSTVAAAGTPVAAVALTVAADRVAPRGRRPEKVGTKAAFAVVPQRVPTKRAAVRTARLEPAAIQDRSTVVHPTVVRPGV
ncbi:MAG: hypothetical protein ABSD64_04270, partial [Terriglobales bacterium]